MSQAELRARNALPALLEALGQVHDPNEEYAPSLRLAMQALEAAGYPRQALSCAWLLNDDETATRLAPLVPPRDRARTWIARALRQKQGDGPIAALNARAAEEFEAAGLIAQAASFREKAGQTELAASLWSRLVQAIGASQESELYASALARFNVARTARRIGQEAVAREAMVAAVHLLEEAADRYEAMGLRERAFDCFQVLAAIGRDSGTVEHALEGWVNLTRILREDQLRSFAIREYAEAVRYLRGKGEIAAAATMARDLATYARGQGLTAAANDALLTQSDLLRELAQTTLQRGSTPEIAENALLASVLSYAELGQFRRVGEVYVELAHLPIEPARRSHYARASARYVGARDEPLEAAPFPGTGRSDTFADVWLTDLVEWEQHGVASEVCADIIVDPKTWSDAVRRRALVARMAALSVEDGDQPAPVAALCSLVESLAPTELYAVMSPLERLFDRPEAEVRSTVVKVLGRLLYKRSFTVLRRALRDPDASVRAQACKSVEQLHFPHAFDPLVRIYRELDDPAARMAALRSLAKLDSEEAAEVVLGALQNAGPTDRARVVAALSGACGPRFLRAAEAALSHLAPEPASAFRQVLLAAQGRRG